MIVNRDEQIRDYILIHSRHSYGYHLFKKIIDIEKIFPNAKPSKRWLREYPHDIVEGLWGSKSNDNIIKGMSRGIGLNENYPDVGGLTGTHNKIVKGFIRKLSIFPAVDEHRTMMHHEIWNAVISFDILNKNSDESPYSKLWRLKRPLERYFGEELTIPTLERYIMECAVDAVISNMEDREYQNGIHSLNEIICLIIPQENHGVHGEYMRRAAELLNYYDVERRLKEINNVMTLDSILNGDMPNIGNREEEHKLIIDISQRTLTRWQGYRPNLLTA